MTECERIVKEGILPESFFESEWICDFYVDEKRKKIWAVELDILRKIHEVCEKYNLTYFLNFGSLLGAVRHKGFIPWDDDLDIVMPRDDYDKFITLESEFLDPYFLQLPGKDDGYYYALARVRNNNTAALDYPFVFQNFNQGIFVDIAPLDGIDEQNGRNIFMQIDNLVKQNSIAMRLSNPRLSKRDIERVKNSGNIDANKNLRMLNELIKINNRDAKDVCIFTTTVYGYDRDVFVKEWFGEKVKVEIFGLETFIPHEYKKILQVIYGNYMNYPPIEKRGEWHSNILWNPDQSYKEILGKTRADIMDGKWKV